MEGDGNLAAGLVDPCADLRGLVDGDAGRYDNRGGDDDACGERAVRTARGMAVVWAWRARAGAGKRGGKPSELPSTQRDTKKTWLRRAVVNTTDMHS